MSLRSLAIKNQHRCRSIAVRKRVEARRLESLASGLPHPDSYVAGEGARALRERADDFARLSNLALGTIARYPHA